MINDAETVDLREAFRTPDADAVPTDSCPDPERLWEAVHGELDGEAFREIVDHVATCAVCAESWRLALEVDVDVSARESRPAVAAGGSRRRSYWGPALAAAAVLLLVVGLQWQQPATDTPAVVRGAESVEPIVPQLETDQRLSRRDCVLEWQGPEGARYDLTVMTEDFVTTVVTEIGLEQPSYRISEDALSAIPEGSRLLWQVRATFVDGGSASFSETFVVE